MTRWTDRSLACSRLESTERAFANSSYATSDFHKAIRSNLPRRNLPIRRSLSAGIPHHAFAGVRAGDVGELAFEGGGGGPAVGPFQFGGRGRQRRVGGLCGAVHDEACTRKR